jgi:hypothetical protein
MDLDFAKSFPQHQPIANDLRQRKLSVREGTAHLGVRRSEVQS